MVYRTNVLRAVNANWNDDGWNLNANSVENPNEWNAGNRVVSRNYGRSPGLRFGSLSRMPRFQPPSMRPISSIWMESAEYLVVWMSFVSQASCKRNFKVSSFEMHVPRPSILLAIDIKLVSDIFSKNFMKCASITLPNPYRSTRGKSLRT